MLENAYGHPPVPGSVPPLSEDDAARILSQGEAPDHFEVLSRRRATPISDEQAAAILKEKAPTPYAADALPVARRAEPMPPAVLSYRGKAPSIHAVEMPPPHTLPLGYRVLRLALWLSVAAASLGAMLSSLRCEK